MRIMVVDDIWDIHGCVGMLNCILMMANVCRSMPHFKRMSLRTEAHTGQRHLQLLHRVRIVFQRLHLRCFSTVLHSFRGDFDVSWPEMVDFGL